MVMTLDETRGLNRRPAGVGVDATHRNVVGKLLGEWYLEGAKRLEIVKVRGMVPVSWQRSRPLHVSAVSDGE